MVRQLPMDSLKRLFELSSHVTVLLIDRVNVCMWSRGGNVCLAVGELRYSEH